MHPKSILLSSFNHYNIFSLIIIKNFYKWGKGDLKIGRVYRYKRDYLPTKFVTAILDLYQKKTELKGVEGQELYYMKAKNMLNSIYGMTVQSPVKQSLSVPTV